MNSKDPLSKLLKSWQPRNPHPLPSFVSGTLREIRLSRAESPWVRFAGAWDEFLRTWMPAPRVFVPVAAAFVLLVAVFHWTIATEKARTVAAMKWQQELTQPLSTVSLTGTYARLEKE